MFWKSLQEIYLLCPILFCPIVLQPTNTFPLVASKAKTIPWATPCIPNGSTKRIQKKSLHFNLEYIIEKLQESYFLAEDLENILKLKLGDPEIIRYLKQKHVKGFPILTTEETQAKVNLARILINHYSHLSRVAVFLEDIYTQEKDREMKTKLIDLFYCHLSQMCEIQMTFYMWGKTWEWPVADRSLVNEKNKTHVLSQYQCYERDMMIILKYRSLLAIYIAEYNGRFTL